MEKGEVFLGGWDGMETGTGMRTGMMGFDCWADVLGSCCCYGLLLQKRLPNQESWVVN